MTENEHFALMAIGAADGRYKSKVSDLKPLVSEYGLIRNRVQVECAWFVALSESAAITECPSLSDQARAHMEAIYEKFSLADAEKIKATERVTNHDVKAVEYFVKEAMSSIPELKAQTEWIHFGCTSEDINNTAYALMLKSAVSNALLPAMDLLIEDIQALASRYADLPMLSRTHGQTASPTTLGKELKNVAARLYRQRQQVAHVEILGKFNGAVGNYNAHLQAYPEIDWNELSQVFLENLGLTQNMWTTQIEPHDYMAELFHALMRFNQILLDYDRDMWSYISIEYFTQRKVEGETGSSTMPHKVNPIDFENSEGNLGIANALLEHLAAKLPVSRWQRDLSDSTALRNIGTAFAHCCIAYQATVKGMSRLDVNETAIAADLDSSWEVLGEAVQTVMRRLGMAEPYEKLKAATRGRRIDQAVYLDILEKLQLPPQEHDALARLKPADYIGHAVMLARKDLA